MYKIIGGDGRVYGPISIQQLRQWIAEGRANVQTLAQSDGATDWKPLGAFSDFAGTFSSPNAPPVLHYEDLRKSKLVAGLLGILLGSLGVHRFYLGYTGIGLAQLLITVLSCWMLSPITAIWGLIEGILILVGSSITTDVDGRSLKEQ